MAELEQAIANYRWAIEQLQQNIVAENVVRLLYARDQIRTLLQTSQKMLVPHQIELVHLDEQLRQLAWSIVEAVNLPQIRQSFNPDEQAWWWFVDQNLPPHPWDRFDWLWHTLTVSGWTINLALLGDIALRFISGGIGFGGATAVIFPSILTGLKARNDLQDKGQDLIKFALEKLGIKSHFREEAKLVSTLILMIVFGVFWLSLPGLSRLYGYLGRRHFEAGKIEAAQGSFHKAIALDQNNMIAHYNLGYLYENLQDLANAKAQYEIASEQDFPEANNNLARIYILENQTSKAIALLREGLAELDANEDSDDDDLRYNLLKNLGWARHKQGVVADADQYLSTAQQIAESSPEVISNRASTYCLQAQNLEIQGKTAQALAKWAACCQAGSIDNPDEDAWIVTATKSLNAAGKTCNKDTSYPPPATDAIP